jgi:hypothetical protein
MKFRTILLGLSALFVAFNAAFFSVSGLSKLFAGASFSVIIMASSLELAKLITAGYLYNYWERINKSFRIYLSIAGSYLNPYNIIRYLWISNISIPRYI